MGQGKKRITPVYFLILVLVFHWAIAESQAQDYLDGRLHMNPRDWKLTLKFEGSSRSSNSTTTTKTDFEEEVSLKQNGYYLDPGIAKFSTNQKFILEQGNTSTSGSASETRSAIFADYIASFSLFHGTVLPYTITGYFTRDSGTINGGLGNRTEFINQNRNLNVYYELPYFPFSFGYSESLRDQTFSSGLRNNVSETENILRTVRYQGKSDKLQINLDYDLFTDKASDNGYNEISSDVKHNFLWGKGSRLISKTSFQNRTGFSPRKKFFINELLKFKHSSKLDSTFNYIYSTLSQTTNTVSHYGSALLNHKVYKNLMSELKFTGSNEIIGTNEETDYLAKLDMKYQKGILWDGKLSSSVGMGYGLTERFSTEGPLQQTDESHTLPFASNAQLNLRFINTGTIVITNSAGTITYTEGVDYQVISVSDNYLEIKNLLVGITDGQTILVDYKYQSEPSTKYSKMPYNFQVEMDFGWISIFEQISGIKYAQTGEDTTSLNDRFNSRTGLNLRWRQRDLETTASAVYSFTTSGNLKTNMFIFNQGLAYDYGPKTSLATSTNQTLTISEGRLTEAYTASISGRWVPSRGLFIRPFLMASMYKSQSAPETSASPTKDIYVGTGLSIRWRVRSIDVSMRYDHDYRTGTTAVSQEDRLLFTLSRKF